jgi:hypothetical protein
MFLVGQRTTIRVLLPSMFGEIRQMGEGIAGTSESLGGIRQEIIEPSAMASTE